MAAGVVEVWGDNYDERCRAALKGLASVKDINSVSVDVRFSHKTVNKLQTAPVSFAWSISDQLVSSIYADLWDVYITALEANGQGFSYSVHIPDFPGPGYTSATSLLPVHEHHQNSATYFWTSHPYPESRLTELNATRSASQLPPMQWLSSTFTPPNAQQQQPQVDQEATSDPPSSPFPEARCPNLYRTVAIGGSFDHLHAGHKRLLTVAASITEGTLIIAVANGVYDTGKGKMKEKSQYMEEAQTRTEKIESFLRRLRPNLTTKIDTVTRCGDPLKCPLTKMDVDAIVISTEAHPWTPRILEERKAKFGKDPYEVIEVPNVLIAMDGRVVETSSSLIRTLKEARPVRK